MKNYLKSAKDFFGQIRGQEEKKKAKSKKMVYLVLFLFITVFSIFVYRSRYALFDKEKQRLVKESPYCLENSDCQIYACTSCGNTMWIERNVPEKQRQCDKKFPMQIACECQANQCKRVYR